MAVHRSRDLADLACARARVGSRDALGRDLPPLAEDPLLEQLDEEVLLGGEIGVEGAAGVAGLGGDGLDAGAVKPRRAMTRPARFDQRRRRRGLALGPAERGRCVDIENSIQIDYSM
jgi:hypothetical protein